MAYNEEDVDKALKARKVPCGEAIGLGWDCNPGHLCPECKTYLKCREAQKEVLADWDEVMNIPYANEDMETVRLVFLLYREIIRKKHTEGESI